MLVKLLVTFLVLNFIAYAGQARAELLFTEPDWQVNSAFAVNSGQFIGDSNMTDIEISRSTCFRRAISDLLSKLGILEDRGKDLGISLSKNRRTIRFGQMYFQSDYAVRVSDRSIKIELGWKF